MAASTTARKPRTRKPTAPTVVVPIADVSAVALERALTNALIFAGTDPELPVLAAVLVTIDETGLAFYATDRYTMVRERVDLGGTSTKLGAVVIPRGSVELLVVALKKYLRTRLPSDRQDMTVALTVSPRDGSPHDFAPDGDYAGSLAVVCGDHGVTVNGIRGGYPNCESILDKRSNETAPFAVSLNPRFIARLAKVNTGDRYGCWHFTQPAAMRPVRAVPLSASGAANPALVVMVMPVRTAPSQDEQ